MGADSQINLPYN